MRALAAGVWLVLAIAGPALARPISEAEAVRIARASFTPRERALQDFGIEDNHSKNPQFYFFSGLWAGVPEGGSVVVGHRAVSVRTGDVWDPVLCGEKIDSHALRRVQAQVRRKIGLRLSEYRRITPRGEYCPWLEGPATSLD